MWLRATCFCARITRGIYQELAPLWANALERIASIEKDWDELGQLFKAFNEQVDAAKLHGTDVLRDQ